MFDPKSRYAKLETYEVTDRRGHRCRKADRQPPLERDGQPEEGACRKPDRNRPRRPGEEPFPRLLRADARPQLMLPKGATDEIRHRIAGPRDDEGSDGPVEDIRPLAQRDQIAVRGMDLDTVAAGLLRAPGRPGKGVDRRAVGLDLARLRQPWAVKPHRFDRRADLEPPGSAGRNVDALVGERQPGLHPLP